jgi:histidyl-tRNA synthetase
MPVFGLNNGMVPIISYNYGARRPDRVKKTIRLSMFTAMGIMLVGVALFEAFPAQLLRIFDADAAMLRDGGLDEAGVAKTFEIMDLKSLDALPDGPAKERLTELFRLAGIAGFADCLEFDISVIRGLAYYTGIVFEAFDVKREFRAIFGGGRYDNLLTTIGGDPATAVGLGFGDVVVTELLKAKFGAEAPLPKKGVYIGYMFPEQREAALALAAKLRAEGECVDLALRKQKPKQFFAHAGAGTCAKAVFLGPDDIAAGKARMKDLETRTETEIALV